MEEYLIFELFSEKGRIEYDFSPYQKFTDMNEAIALAQFMHTTEEENKMKHGNYVVYQFRNKQPYKKVYDSSQGKLLHVLKSDFKPIFGIEDISLLDQLIHYCVDSGEIELCYKLKDLKNRIDNFLNES